ncbi:hypothetical protein H310_02687 [Aphanomyces invadans]|uniref:Uncharacterized protein n=1 Tax=Aphanomyces invadans TaxID=157072 RepID=A0A024UJV5_9STRA|nr:hypothetical protein H310_02687 [Aphanomyces invadans]ETW06430.1 hypothetical protein H310_02687 [Aphanomyces invadans]|eukprot:XP_008864505.1 hypothetical protein H310_02687 [Aphanomyces invadans]
MAMVVASRPSRCRAAMWIRRSYLDTVHKLKFRICHMLCTVDAARGVGLRRAKRGMRTSCREGGGAVARPNNSGGWSMGCCCCARRQARHVRSAGVLGSYIRARKRGVCGREGAPYDAAATWCWECHSMRAQSANPGSSGWFSRRKRHRPPQPPWMHFLVDPGQRDATLQDSCRLEWTAPTVYVSLRWLHDAAATASSAVPCA